MLFPIPHNEAERLAELHALDLLSAPPSPVLDGVCLLARKMFKVPSACIALVDRDRQWFRASSGFDDITSTPRADSFGAWTIMGGDLLVVPDAGRDPRFRDKVHIPGQPHIRFYAGAPIALRTGLSVGALCLFGPEPREFEAGEPEIMAHLAQIIVDQFRLHEATRQVRRELEHRRTSQSLLEMQSRELWRRQSLVAQTERLAKLGGWELDVATRRLSWSDGVYRILGLPLHSEPTEEIALSHLPFDARRHVRRQFARALRTGQGFEMELPFIDAAGQRRLFRQSCELEIEQGKPVRAFGIVQDVTESKQAEQRMWHMANHDALTDLPNRGLMRDKLDVALRRARRSGGYVGVLLVDLDHFKDVNDTLGHDVGDALLVEVARRLRASVSEVDTVARLGGDEFIVLLSHMENADDGMIVARRVLSLLDMPFDYGLTTPLSCRGSIGLTVAPDHGMDPSTLLKNADIALYCAKSEGRGIALVYDPRMQEATESRIKLAARVRLGLKKGEFQPFYQPKVSLSTGAIVGFEALMRWRHPRLGVLGPQSFSAIFEDPHLSVEIGERLLQITTRDMAQWSALGCDFGHVAINVSSPEFAQGELPDRVLTALNQAGLGAERLTIEVTETVFLGRGTETVRQSLQLLNRAGVRIALDDFGTGFASLSHLRQFPVDRIKIDRSFVHDIEQDLDDAAIVRAVINLGHSLGIETVAEGVETFSQAAYLRANGCEYAQGYLYSEALPASQVPALLKGWNPESAAYRTAEPQEARV